MVPVILGARASRSSVSQRVSVLVGLGTLAALWLVPEPLFLFAWVAFFAWVVSRVVASRHVLSVVLVAVASAVPAVTWAVGVESGPLPALAVIIAAGVVPFHLWLTALEHRLTPAELQVVLVAQPGLAFLHRWESLHHAELPGASWALAALVVSALAQTGLGLIRTSPRRALNALTFSQSALLVAGAVAHEAGWQAARLLWLSLAVGTLVLHSIAGELERTWGVHRLAPDNGLAAVEPMLHRSFVAMGFLFVGIPGGAAFFAEDLLFHSLVETNVTATVVFLAAVALNAVVFYRLYLGLFAGPTRPRTPHPTLRSPSLGYVYLALLGVVVLGGLWPGLFLSGH